MKNFFSKPMCLLALAGSMNVASGMDNNGVFIGAGYLQGVAQMHANIHSQKQATNTTIKGFNVKAGYQFFFGKYFGLRAYGFFDYAHANALKLKNPNYKGVPSDIEKISDTLHSIQDGANQVSSIAHQASSMVSNVQGNQISEEASQIGSYQSQTQNTLNQITGIMNKFNPQTFEPNMLTYGGAMDLMVNLVNNGIMSLGAFGGVQLAGNSWIMATPDFVGVLSTQMRVSKKATSFQFLFNVGGRLRILKHSSIEMGVKFPMLKKSPFITAKNMDLGFRRVYSWYVNYVFTF
ncbi:outer membrane protein [Helicobacter cetorum]|uniref:Outer membrane protein 33 n=1 Tax=Helicobacter cetorum (strain ATCC BAA-540 / CCUG 52418 / MIT 99-5656) TaxID=1163745 RepID=I0ESN2_HELCM|nr:outer membrane protein [Helicobacter cetorum]AFI05951.1 outer membrane protein 33 [Helicobacter cetorum MIT 99-5656]